ncbi:MAG: inosine/xanthosine triphosphatase [Pyrobaculum sp.]
MLVAVASRNPNKVRAVEIAYRLFGIPARVISIDKPGGLPRQPVGLSQVVAGAVARAKHAVMTADVEHGVGIEAGAVAAGEMHLDVTIAAIVDRSGGVTLGVGPGFKIPTVFLDEVLKGVELGAVAEERLKTPAVGYREGLVGVLTRGRVTRLDLNLTAVAMALIPRLPYNKGLYQDAAGSGARI